jgi:hypothetical protein
VHKATTWSIVLSGLTIVAGLVAIGVPLVAGLRWPALVAWVHEPTLIYRRGFGVPVNPHNGATRRRLTTDTRGQITAPGGGVIIETRMRRRSRRLRREGNHRSERGAAIVRLDLECAVQLL